MPVSFAWPLQFCPFAGERVLSGGGCVCEWARGGGGSGMQHPGTPAGVWAVPQLSGTALTSGVCRNCVPRITIVVQLVLPSPLPTATVLDSFCVLG